MKSSRQRNRRAKKPNSPTPGNVLGRVRAAIGKAQAGRAGPKGISYGVNRYRETLKISEIKQAVSELSVHPAYKSFVWPSPFPRSWETFANRGFATCLEFGEELEWSAQSLICHAEKIRWFIRQRKQYELYFMSGDYMSAETCLKLIETEMGLSIWLAESTIALKQKVYGYQSQRDYVKPILANTKIPVLIRYILSWVGFKYEENTSFAQLSRMMSRFGGNGSGLEYLIRLLYGTFIPLSADDAAQALSFADTLPVLDRYLVILKVVQAVVSTNPDSGEVKSAVRHSLTQLARELSTPSILRTLLAVGGEVSPARLSAPFAAALESYTLGDYSTARECCLAELQQNPTNIAATDLCTRAEVTLGLDNEPLQHRSASLASDVKNSLRELVEFSAGALEGRRNLQKIGLVYANCTWAPAVQLLTAPRLTQPLKPDDVQRLCYLALQCAEDHPALAAPLRMLLAPESYLKWFNDATPLACTLMELVFGNTPGVANHLQELGLPEGRKSRFLAIALIQRGDAASAIPILAEAHSNASSRRERYDAGQTLVDTLLQVGELGRCAEVAARLFLQSTYFASTLPIAELVSSIVDAQEEGAENGARGNLSVATVTDMYARYVSPDKGVARSDAYKDFLRTNGKKKASEIGDELCRFPREEFIYFLRYVCVPEVMDQSLALPSTTAVEDERVAVLLMLTELTPESDRETQLSFLEELREIRTRQVVRDTNKRLEQSKIFVNVEGIKKRLDASMRDSWNRYRLLSLQPAQGEDLVEEVRRLLNKHAGSKVITLSMSLPETEKGKLFAQMVAEIRDLFVESKEFGLDANLSANIRHGYVLREIRSPLLAQNLVTNRPSEDQPYDPDTYWSERLPTLDQNERRDLIVALAEFSANVDQRIEDLNGRVLRINSSGSPEGIFLYPLTGARLSYLQQTSEKIESHEDLMTHIIDYMWTATESNLAAARAYLQGPALQGFSEALDLLEKRLSSVASSWKLTSLRSSITLARPELQAAVGRVASWFTLSTEVEHPDYAASTAYQAGMETIRSYASNIEFRSTLTSNEEVVLRGWTLPFIGRIVFIILDNVVEHSGVKSGELDLECTIELKDGFLVFEIANELGLEANLDELRERVKSVNEEYGTEKATQFISVEKRSGYPKIWKIMTHDLHVDHVLEVSVDTLRRRFTVQIMIAAGGIIR